MGVCEYTGFFPQILFSLPFAVLFLISVLLLAHLAATFMLKLPFASFYIQF